MYISCETLPSAYCSQKNLYNIDLRKSYIENNGDATNGDATFI